jgi:CheY-like chemotaxis protein
MMGEQLDIPGRVARNLVHAINESLAVIVGGVEAVSDRNTPLDDAVERIRSAAARGAGLTSHLAALTSDDAAELVWYDLNQVLAGLEQVLPLALPPGKTLVMELDRRPCMVLQDPVRFQRALLSLASDAPFAENRFSLMTQICELAPDEVDDLLPGTYVRLAVGDLMSDRAVTARTCLNEPGGGNASAGGAKSPFSLSLEAARLAGGRLLRESGPGEKSCICFYLPLGNGADDQAPVRQAQRMETVLIAEDNAELLAVNRERFKSMGFEVLAVASGDEALALLKRTPDVSVLFSDVLLPGMDGITLAQQARQISPGIIIILTSGFPPSGLSHSLRDFHFIGKPYRTADVLRLLRKAS